MASYHTAPQLPFRQHNPQGVPCHHTPDIRLCRQMALRVPGVVARETLRVMWAEGQLRCSMVRSHMKLKNQLRGIRLPDGSPLALPMYASFGHQTALCLADQ